MAEIAYLLCALSSLICFVLLLRAYLNNHQRLLLWSSACFFFYLIQNAVLFADLVIVPQIDLTVWRAAAGLCGSALFLFALIWETRS